MQEGVGLRKTNAFIYTHSERLCSIPVISYCTLVKHVFHSDLLLGSLDVSITRYKICKVFDGRNFILFFFVCLECLTYYGIRGRSSINV